MDQNAETNGCDDSPVSVGVSNHTEVVQCSPKLDKQMAKLSSQESKKSRSAASNAKGGRGRRAAPTTPQNSTSTTSPPSERRATRNITQPPPAQPPQPSPTKPTRTPTAAERKATPKISTPTPVTNAQSNKKSSHQQPPVLSLASSEGAPVLSQETALPNSRLSKHSQQQSPFHSSPPHLKSQKRGTKRQHPAEVLSAQELASRASKRVRLQHQPFQSPPPPTIIPAILRQQVIKTPEDKIVVFQRGEFLAVRNETGSFFVCRTAQNVYKSSKRFKIQWMSDKEPDVYIPDFYDQTDFECVLTNLRMKRVDKNKYALPPEERQRTLNILQRALNVENGMDIVKMPVTTDGVDVSIVGKEDEEEIIRLQQEKIKEEQKVQPTTPIKNRGRPRRPELPVKTTRTAAAAAATATTAAAASVVVKSEKKVNKSSVAAKVNLRLRETVKVKLKEEESKVLYSEKTGKPVRKLKKIAERLHPNPKVTVYEKDPTFEMNVPIPYVSSSAHSKLLIRAILLKDMNMLQSLLKDTQKICSLNCYRSVDVKLTPLMYAVLEEDHRAIKALLTTEKKKYANPPETLLEYQSSGNYNMTMLGYAVKSIGMCRGGKEGNNAFLKDMDFCNETYPDVSRYVIIEALKAGVSRDTLNLLLAENKDFGSYSWERDEILKHIYVAIRYGHHKLAGQLVSDAIANGGYGFGKLHKEVLSFVRQPLSPFKAASVPKKAIGNEKITPLHCAAINPNPQYLSQLLSTVSDYTITDEKSWRLIHYASVCSSTGPLELLISRGVSLEETESEGNTALHIAAMAGRAHNVDLILRHLIASEHNKKETAITVSLQDKQCVNAIDRGNKKSYTALHIACKEGHIDVVRVLIRHKANVDKLTNAQNDKITPLMLAAQKGHLDVVSLLIEHSAQVEMKDKKQRTALTHAIINGHANVTSYLLRLGANPNSTDSSGNTLVHYAAAYGWYYCMKLLIEAGASLNLPNDWKITPLSLAFMKGHMGLVDFLVEQPGIDINVDVNNDSGMTLVMQALRAKINSSMLERIHFLVVKQKSDCTKVDFMGNNAFHHLVLAEVEEMESERKMEIDEDEIDEDESCEDECSDDFKLSEKIKQNAKDKLMFKEESQQEHDALIQEITKLLLDHGCDPMVKNKEGDSPFNLAIKEGCLLLVKMFLDAGCQLNLDVSQSGDNVLHYLVNHAKTRKVEPMLQAIMNAFQKCSNPEAIPHQLLCEMAKMYNKNGYTPLLQALSTLGSCCDEESLNRLLTFIKFLLDECNADVSVACKDKNNVDASYALHLASMCSGGRVIEVLLAHKPPLNVFDSDGLTPLLLAIKRENVEAVEALVKAGANTNLKSTDEDKLSPLLLAAKNPNLGKIVQLLVHNKADVNDVDVKNGNTALHYVVQARASDVLETAKALLTAGANVDAVNNSTRTPLHLSVNSSHSESNSSYAIEECLLGFGAKADALDCRGRMPIRYAFTKIGRPFDKLQIDPMELVVLLIDAMPPGAIEVPDQFGQTLLHSAAYRGATISVTHIAKHMKGLEARDNDGNTALGLAVRNGHESCALMLLQRGANCTAEVVTPVREKEIDKTVWLWKNAIPEQIIPERHTILQETLLKDWQGILYLMLDQLDSAGKGISIAVEAALRTAKYNVALKLIGRIKHTWSLMNGSNSMLHVLSKEATADTSPDLQVKVAQFLIEKGIPPMSRDEHDATVVTYASLKWNYPLCSFIASKVSLSAAADPHPDKSGRTPLSAVFWNITKKDIPEDMRNWCCTLIKNGCDPNTLVHYPITIGQYPGVRCTVKKCLHLEDPSLPKYSPLIMAIYRGNYSVVKLLLSKGADVNYPDDRKRTPLMHAAKLNDIRMVKLLINNNYDPTKDKDIYSIIEPGTFQKTSSVNLAAQDVDGWTVIHYIVNPLSEFCYTNTVILNLLSEIGAPLDTPNAAGETPLQMASKLQRGILVDALQKLLNTPEDQKIKLELNFPTPVLDEIKWDQPSYNFVDDSKEYLGNLQKELVDTDKQHDLRPDPLSGFENVGEIVVDVEKDMPYDIVMTVVDLNYGAYGIYNFYKMQIIKHKSKDLYLLFTCWGRVGDTGQYQKTPFSTLSDSVKEFTKIFKTKSGNNWDDVKNFHPQPKKYRLVQLEKAKTIPDNNIKLSLANEVPSKLSSAIKILLESMMDTHTMEGTLRDLGVTISFDTLPFGSLTETTLIAAESILKDISDIILDKDNLLQNVKSQEKFAELMHKIVKLSEEFYQLIPVFGYQYEKLCPLFSPPDVHSKLDLIHNLMHIGLSSKLLLGASLRSSAIHPVDYIYRSLGCSVQLLDQSSSEAQMILQYIYNTSIGIKPKVHAIFAVHFPQQSEEFKSINLSNHMLLWHGTRLSNMLAILNRGLQIAPLGAPTSGHMLGKGIYFADMFQKSQKYCVHHSSSSLKSILLCEVALGDIKEVDYGLVVDPSDKFDSVKAFGHKQPDPSQSVFWNGMTVPLGTPINALEHGDSSSHHYLNFNEYVIYKSSQVCIRYLIQFSD